jgi:hypothetical protein
MKFRAANSPAEMPAFLQSVLGVLSKHPAVLGVHLGKCQIASFDYGVFIVLDKSFADNSALCDQLLRSLGSISEILFHGDGLYTCLYRNPQVHVAISCIDQEGISSRISRKETLWERNSHSNSSDLLNETKSPRKIDGNRTERLSEGHFWILFHMLASKFHRGELFEAARLLNTMRSLIILPLLSSSQRTGESPSVRRLERSPTMSRDLNAIICSYEELRNADTLHRIADFPHRFRLSPYFSQDESQTIRVALIDYLDNNNAECKVASNRIEGERLGGAATCSLIASAAFTRLLPVFAAAEQVLGVTVANHWMVTETTIDDALIDPRTDLLLNIVVQPAESDLAWRAKFDQELAADHFILCRMGQDLVGLYKDPLVRVRYRFISPSRFKEYTVPQHVLLDKHGLSTPSALLGRESASGSLTVQPPRDWIRRRFWMSIFDCVNLMRRHELIKLASDLDNIRATVLGPFIAEACGRPRHGLRRIEARYPSWASLLEPTVPNYSVSSCWGAIESTVKVYQNLQRQLEGDSPPSCAEIQVLDWLDYWKDAVLYPQSAFSIR